MVHFPAFAVEQWMDRYETKCTHNLAETCADSISLKQLLSYAAADGAGDLEKTDFMTRRMTYLDIRGSTELRGNVASLYAPEANISPENVLITQAAIGANFLALLTLTGPGDHVVCLHDVPLSFGVKVSLWKLRPDNGGRHDVTELESLLNKETRLVIINNPNNPTGQTISTATLRAIVEAVKAHAAPGCVILSDEVYRPLFHSLPADAPEPPASILDLGYPHAVATGSLSKAYSLAGLRVGWFASPRADIIEAAALRRDYNVISVSGVDDMLAARALGPNARRQVLERNVELARGNREILKSWISSRPGRKEIRWTETQGGTTALLYLGEGVDDEAFCRRLCEEAGVLLVPAGTCFGWPGWVRIGYVSHREELREGLEKLAGFLAAWTL